MLMTMKKMKTMVLKMKLLMKMNKLFGSAGSFRGPDPARSSKPPKPSSLPLLPPFHLPKEEPPLVSVPSSGEEERRRGGGGGGEGAGAWMVVGWWAQRNGGGGEEGGGEGGEGGRETGRERGREGVGVRQGEKEQCQRLGWR